MIQQKSECLIQQNKAAEETTQWNPTDGDKRWETSEVAYLRDLLTRRSTTGAIGGIFSIFRLHQ